MSLPNNKTQLLNQAQKLPYRERIALAAKVGVQLKNSPKLPALIKDLRQHPPPESAEVEADNGFTELLPPQKLNVAHYYDQDQLALTAALASKTQGKLFIEEFNSPSKFFLNIAAKGIAKQITDAQVIIQQVQSAPPAARKKLLQNLIRYRQVEVLDKLYPIFLDLPGGIENTIVHGCSSKIVRQFLEKPLWEHSAGLDIEMLWRFHTDVLFQKLIEELGQAKPREREDIWRKFFSGEAANAIKHPNLIKKIWEISTQYQEKKEIVTDEGSIEVDEFPDIISWGTYLKHIGPSFLQYIKSKNLLERSPNYLHVYVSTYDINSFDFNTLKYFFEYILEQWTDDVYLGAYDYDSRHIIGSFHLVFPRVIAKAKNSKMVVEIAELFLPYLNKKAANPKEKVTSSSSGSYGALPVVGSNQEMQQKKYNVWQEDVLTIFSNVLSEIRKHRKSYLTKHPSANDDPNGKKILEGFQDDIMKMVSKFLPLQIKSWSKGFVNAEMISNLYKMLKIRKIKYPSVAGFFFDSFKPIFDMAPSYTTEGVTKEGNFLRVTFKFLLALLRSQNKLIVQNDQKQQATQIHQKIFKYCVGMFSSNVESCTDYIILFMSQNSVKHKKAKKLFSDEELQQLYKIFQSDKETLLNMAYEDHKKLLSIWRYLSSSVYQKDLENFLQSTKISEEFRDAIQSFRNVDNNTVRKELTKASDSNSPVERLDAIGALCQASFRADNKATHLKRTLNFIREKIKNEQITYRIAATAMLFDLDQRKDMDFLFPPGIDKEVFQIWFSMLQDALEVQDLDKDPDPNFALPTVSSIQNRGGKSDPPYMSHPLLTYYLHLSQEALVRGCIDKASGLFDFGAELQYRIAKFKMSGKDLNQQWKLSYPNSISKVKGKENEFIQLCVEAYDKLLSEKNPRWKDNFLYWKDLYGIVGDKWNDVDILKLHIPQVIESVKQSKKDPEGLFIIESDHPALLLTEYFITIQPKDWQKIELIKDLIEVILHSRQAMAFVFHWIKGLEVGPMKRRQQKAIRDSCVTKLLSISPSAIHLRFVWSHLLRWRQDLLDQFIHSKKSYRGVFYLPPVKRYKNKAEAKKANQAVAKPSRYAPKTMKEPQYAVKGVKELVKQEAKEEKKLVKENLEDHEDFFCLPACYGLHRLSVQQANNLAIQWAEQILNPARSIPKRVEACIRWTIVPTVTYSDIVSFLNKYQQKKPDDGGKNISGIKNLIESLMKGTILNDEPMAPLNYLLSPTFLSSDYARIGAYAISACVPHMRGKMFTSIIKMLLTGKTRESLKVTAYKEIIRLLALNPTTEHVNFISHEWKRQELHRDLRITIIGSAVTFLNQVSEHNTKVAWEIIDSVLKKYKDWKDSVEILTALLGVTPVAKYRYAAVTLPPELLQKTKISKSYEMLTKKKISAEHAERFVKTVVLPLCTTAEDDDIKFLAFYSLVNFHSYISDEAAQLLTQYLTDTNSPLLNSQIPSEQKIYKQRWEFATRSLLHFTGINPMPTYDSGTLAKTSYITTVIEGIAKVINKLPIDQHTKRSQLMTNLNYILSQIPAAQTSGKPTIKDDKLISALGPLKPLFYLFFQDRRVTLLLSEPNNPDAARIGRDILEELLKAASSSPVLSEEAINIAKKIFVFSRYSPTKLLNPVRMTLLSEMMKSYVEDKKLSQTRRLHIAKLVFLSLSCMFIRNLEDNIQSDLISFLETSLTHPDNDFTENITSLISTSEDSSHKPFQFILDYFIKKVTYIKSTDIEKNRRACVSIKDVVEKLFKKKPELFALASAPDCYLAIHFLFQYEVNSHTYINQFAQHFVKYLEALKDNSSTSPDTCVTVIKALADMKLEDLGGGYHVPKDEAFRVASLNLVYIILTSFRSTFVVDCPDSFYNFLTAVIDPSLQIANCTTLVTIITQGFTEKSKQINLIKERDSWFAAGLDLIERLLNLKANQSLAAAVAVDLLLIFFKSLDKTTDTSVKSTYAPKFVSLLAKFCTHPDPTIQSKAMLESVPPGYDSFTIPSPSRKNT